MITQFEIRLDGKDHNYRVSSSAQFHTTHVMLSTIRHAMAKGCSLVNSFEQTQMFQRISDKELRGLEPAEWYINFDLDNLLMAEYGANRPRLMVTMPDTYRLGILNLRLMQTYQFTLASLLDSDRPSTHWLGHANLEMDPLPLKDLSLYYLQDAEQFAWQDVLKSKVVSASSHPQKTGHLVYKVSGVSAHRLQSLHTLIMDKIEQNRLWEEECQDIIKACVTTGRFSSPDFPEDDYSWGIVKMDDSATIAEQIVEYDWAIRTGFVYKDVAFVQQVEGGDEWLALKRDGDTWVPFESYSLSRMALKNGIDYCLDLIEQCAEAAKGHLLPEDEGETGPVIAMK